jgi:hypothetical protein
MLMNLSAKMFASRRALLIGAGAASVAAAGAAVTLMKKSSRVTASIWPIDHSKVTEIGEGYFLVDGWVLTEDDIKNFHVARPEPSRE